MTTTQSLADELVVSFERSLTDLLPMAELLEAAARDEPVSEARHKDLVGLGLLEIAIPDSSDGLGLDDAGVAAMWRVAGRRLVPSFVREEALTLVPLLHAAASDTRASDWLRGVRSGSVTGGGRVVVGSDGSSDEVAVWAAPGSRLIGVVANDGARVFELTDGDLSPRSALDPGQGLCTLRLAGRSPSLTVAGAIVTAIAERAQLAALAEATGSAERALEMSIDYGRTREQFGRPIAQFQAIAHLLADMRVDVEACRSTLARLCALGSGPAREDLLAVGRFAIPRAARAVCEGAIQVHGGTGFAWEYGLHLYYRRVLQIQAEFGSAEEAARVVGSRLLERMRR